MKTKKLNREMLAIFTQCAMVLTECQDSNPKAACLAYNLWKYISECEKYTHNYFSKASDAKLSFDFDLVNFKIEG